MNKLRYHFDNFMAKGGWSVFTALLVLFAIALLGMGLFRVLAGIFTPTPEEAPSVLSQFWTAFLQISDAGAIAEDTGGPWPVVVVGIITIFLGLVLFSSLVAFVTSQFEAKLSELRKGKSPVVEKGHTLILGYGNRLFEILKELVIAKASESHPVVVILSEMPKDELDDLLRDRLGSTAPLKVVTRCGSPATLKSLENVSAQKARSIVLLSGVGDDASPEEKALADARQLKTLMAVLTICGNSLPPVVAEFHLKEKGLLARRLHPSLVLVDEDEILSKLIVQTSRISGLAQVYDTLVGFEGSEMYFWPLSLKTPLTYRELVFSFPTCSVMGFRTSQGQITLNPPQETVVPSDGEVLLIAEDDSLISLTPPVLPPLGDWTTAPGQPPRTERQMIVGWNRKAPVILEEYLKYLTPGSVMDLVMPHPDDTIRQIISGLQEEHGDLKTRLIKAEVQNPDVVAQLKPETYDNVIILTPELGDAEQQDVLTIGQLLVLRTYLAGLEKDSYPTQLITEVADSENTRLIMACGAKDFLISNQFVSKIFAQVTENPELYKVYEDLFSPEGSEIYLKPLGKYTLKGGRYTFAQLCQGTLLRNETCIGVRLRAFAEDSERSYGIVLNPPKSQVFTLGLEDELIVLAENEF